MVTAELTTISPRYSGMELADTDIEDLSERQQHRVRGAVGNLLIAMFEGNGEPYVTDFVVVLDTGERVGYECQLSAETCRNVSRN